MGRKKKNATDGPKEEEERRDNSKASVEDSDDEDYERKHYDIDPDIRELAYAYGIDEALTQKLNDIMIEERQRTWEQDIAKLYEILKDAHTPSAMLNLKLKDMERGVFVGKARCGPKVQDLARRHRLDKGASTKLEDAMSIREAMGKDVEKDLALLDEHLAASNKPSALVSMKLDGLRKGFNIGHCIYSREPMPGNTGPGVDGVFDKRAKRALGYTDADLDRRFAEQSAGVGAGGLMDEAAARRMVQQERRKFEAKVAERVKRSRSRSRRWRRSPSRDRSKSSSVPPPPKRRKSPKESHSKSRRRSRSHTGGRKKASSRKGEKRSLSRRSTGSSGKSSWSPDRHKEPDKGKEKVKDKVKNREKQKEKDKERDRERGKDDEENDREKRKDRAKEKEKEKRRKDKEKEKERERGKEKEKEK